MRKEAIPAGGPNSSPTFERQLQTGAAWHCLWYKGNDSGDFNNDLTLSETPGDIWSASFTGTSVSIIAPKETGAGRIEVQIDGETRATADLSTTGDRLSQQTVYEVNDLARGNHTIDIINRGRGPWLWMPGSSGKKLRIRFLEFPCLNEPRSVQKAISYQFS